MKSRKLNWWRKSKYKYSKCHKTGHFNKDSPKLGDINEGEKNHKKGGLNCVFGNFFFYVLDNCPQVQSLK